MQSEKTRLSPRGIEQGWAAELDKSMVEQRVLVTVSKARALFQVAKPLREDRAKLERYQQDLCDMEYQLQQVGDAGGCRAQAQLPPRCGYCCYRSCCRW